MKVIKIIFAAFALFLTVPAIANTIVTDSIAPATNDVRIEQLKQRITEIKATDKSTLSGEEKRVLRNEKKGLSKELKVISGGVYVSVGALILILILLIILL